MVSPEQNFFFLCECELQYCDRYIIVVIWSAGRPDIDICVSLQLMFKLLNFSQVDFRQGVERNPSVYLCTGSFSQEKVIQSPFYVKGNVYCLHGGLTMIINLLSWKEYYMVQEKKQGLPLQCRNLALSSFSSALQCRWACVYFCLSANENHPRPEPYKPTNMHHLGSETSKCSHCGQGLPLYSC